MAQHTYTPGIPVDYQQNLPVATTAQVALAGRAVVNDTPANIAANHTYRWNGAQ